MQFSAKIKTSNIYDPEHQVLFHCSENFIFSFMREWTHAIQFNDLNELLFKFKDFILKLIRKPKCVSTSILKWQNLHFNWMSLNSISSRYLNLCKVHPNSKICKLSTMQFSASRLYQGWSQRWYRPMRELDWRPLTNQKSLNWLFAHPWSRMCWVCKWRKLIPYPVWSGLLTNLYNFIASPQHKTCGNGCKITWNS